MTNREQRIAVLAEANRKRHEDKRDAVEKALVGLLRDKSKVNVSIVATSAGVSRNFVYKQRDLLQRIQDAGAGLPQRLHRPRTTPSTEASLRARLVDALDALDSAKKEIAALHRKVERLTEELASQMSYTN